jgi:ABC-type Mn2+/Zn2+ transport system ATPase subunit
LIAAFKAEHARTNRRRIEAPVLRRLSLAVPRGSLVAVVGKVGGGKSALMHALLGEMPLLAGSMERNFSSISYVPQEAWIR